MSALRCSCQCCMPLLYFHVVCPCCICRILSVLSWQPRRSPLLASFLTDRPGSPFLAVLSWQSCSASPVLPIQFCLSCLPVLSSCLVLPVLFCLSCSACSVLPVLFYLPCSARPVLVFLSLLCVYILYIYICICTYKIDARARKTRSAKL
jgi:hypothetical protein